MTGSRTCAVMQPAYLPWLGYLDLMDQVDVFVFLDSVQFVHRSWQHRNRIPRSGNLEWLSVPTVSRDRRSRRISEVRIAEADDFPRRHVDIIEATYRRSQYGSGLDALLERLAGSVPGDSLSDLTIDLIEMLRDRFAITTPTLRSSQLEVAGVRSELLIDVCRVVGADTYVTPPGSVGYLSDDAELFAEAGLPVDVHVYEHPTYEQLGGPFVSHASSIDLLALAGPAAGDILRSGRRPAEPLIDLPTALAQTTGAL